MYRKFYIILLVILAFSLSSVYGENVSQCDFLYSQFLNDGYNPKQQYLENTDSSEFPYNILLKSNDKSSGYVLISIEDASSVVKELEDISQFANVICTANDNSIIFPDYAAGTETAITNLNLENVQTPVLYLSINKKNDRYWTLTPGSKGLLSPSYTFLKIKKALEKENIHSYIENGSLALYKINLAKSNPIMQTLLANGYPAIKLNFQTSNKEKLVSVVKNFVQDYDINNPKNQEVNYDSASIFSFSFIISESTLTIIFLSVAAFSLFSICVFSFMFGRKKTMHKKTMLKYWYIAPLFLLIALFCLTLSQMLTKWIFPVWSFYPQYALIIKFIFTFVFFSLFYILRKGLRIPSRLFVYSYLLNIISFVNLFVFSALDLPFLLIFGLEYILIYISQGFKKTSLLLISTILLILPFIPTLYGVFNNSDFSSLMYLVDGNFFINLILSLFILPFTFMVMRIILSFKKRIYVKRQIIKLLILILIFVILLITTICINKNLKDNKILSTESVEFVSTDKDLASFSLSSTNSIGFSDNKLIINSIENVIYYEIKIFSDFPFPIYSANFPFSFFETQNAAQFNLAENPPKNFTLDFLTEEDEDFTIEIKAYAQENFSNKTNTPIIETRKYVISNSKNLSEISLQDKKI